MRNFSIASGRSGRLASGRRAMHCRKSFVVPAFAAVMFALAGSAVAQEKEAPGRIEQFGQTIGKKVDSALERFDAKKAIEDVRGDIRNLRNEVIGLTRKYLDVDVQTHLVSTGEQNPLPEQAGTFLSCKPISDWAKEKCPDARVRLREHYKKQGASCPQVIATVTCISR